MARTPNPGWGEAGGIQGFLQSLKVQTTQPVDNNVVNLDRRSLDRITDAITKLQQGQVHLQAERARMDEQLLQIEEALRVERERFCGIGRDLGVKCEVP